MNVRLRGGCASHGRVRRLCYVALYGNRWDNGPTAARDAVRFQLLPSGTGAGCRRTPRRTLGARRVPHGRREEPLLSAPRPDARRRHRRRLASDRADEGSDRRPRSAGRRRSAARFEHRAGTRRATSPTVSAQAASSCSTSPRSGSTTSGSSPSWRTRRSRCSPSTRPTASPSGATTSVRTTSSLQHGRASSVQSECWRSPPQQPRASWRHLRRIRDRRRGDGGDRASTGPT